MIDPTQTTLYPSAGALLAARRGDMAPLRLEFDAERLRVAREADVDVDQVRVELPELSRTMNMSELERIVDDGDADLLEVYVNRGALRPGHPEADLRYDLADGSLAMSRSMRSTWIWARDATECDHVRACVTAAGAICDDAHFHGALVPNVIDVATGANAGDALVALEKAGYHLVPADSNGRPRPHLHA